MKPMPITALFAFLLLVTGCNPTAPKDTDSGNIASPHINLTLAPQARVDAPDTIGSVQIQLQISGKTFQKDAPVLQIPLVSSNVDTVATIVTDLKANDANGPLTLSAMDKTLDEQNAGDAVIGGNSRLWYADRQPDGPIHVTYTVPANASLPPRGPAPPFSFLSKDGGTSAAGHVFLILPPGDDSYQTEIDWDLTAAPPESRGISSIGEGHVSAEMTAVTMRMSFYMMGNVQTYPEIVPENGFFSAWYGTPPFDAENLMHWTADLYTHYSAFFGMKEVPPYGVFLRYNPVNAGGGVGLHHSFVTTFGEQGDTTISGLKSTLAHEMFHTFQPFIEEPGGLESSWFGEGLAVFYQARLPTRFAMMSSEDFLADLNFAASRYYTSLMAEAPNSEIPKKFWLDTRIRTLPYDRGMLYFATVDHELRTQTEGEVTLDTLMLKLLEQSNNGHALTNSDWEKELNTHLGPSAVAEFQDFLNGTLIVPDASAFGPCFTRTQVPLRRYELGFDPAVLSEPTRIIRNLVIGSAADQAGLQNGDEIVHPIPQDHIQGEQTQELTVTIRRNGDEFTLSYLPRGETVDAYQWIKNPNHSDENCEL
ncbi:peptidase M61 [Hirschia baltica]|uniref:Peptidase M61 domain protein n=1 Tax=Hirschia baltica (strain ATCC 49814 / DSM 5838 / IFAM 1418) TaxID=582402 RepID=C6XPT7_HIRBI|nr:peptidase M61 [Hirschia baltica]ACT60352.1 conserved hypothetical protein [Hirschia baltica ATCC 49814]